MIEYGVYFLKNDGKIIYIGQTKDIKKRIGYHKLDKIFDSYRFMPCSKDKLNEYESRLIKFFKPSLNKTSIANYSRNENVEFKTDMLEMRVTQSFLDLTKRKAAEKRMTLSRYIEMLITENCNK